MTVSGDYEKIIEDNLKEELEWLEQEFEYLFKNKKEKTQQDINIGNQILEKVISEIKSNKSEQVLNILAITLNKIEQDYPEFF